MARKEEAKAVKAFKDAKTGEEMVRSWASQTPGRNVDALVEQYRVFIDKRPDLIEIAHRQLQNVMDRGILDRKTRELCLIAILLTLEWEPGVVAHIANAKAGGVTEEEILEVAALVCYEATKHASITTSKALKAGFEASRSVTLYES